MTNNRPDWYHRDLYLKAQAEIDRLTEWKEAYHQKVLDLENDIALKMAENDRYREALEYINVETSNRPSGEAWGYYCGRLYNIHIITDEVLTERPEKEEK